jgi:NAD(P)-dependent dehydrogenase (short-subunit alcohol dehydrogenase family)
MSSLDGIVAIITGAGRGIGREHALLMAAVGAQIVVNDLGGAIDGSGSDQSPAEETAAEIRAMGGEAIADAANVTDWEGVQGMINAAISEFGDLHVLVNNAGILRDRVIVNMTEAEWDAVIAVHMKGHFVPTHWAAAYWREQVKAGNEVNAAIVNTASGAMLGNLGQFNYTGAKAAIAAMTLVSAGELSRYGVRSNCLAPLARTRLTLQTPGMEEAIAPPEDAGTFDIWDPANISPLVAYLSTADCPFNGGVFHVGGNEVGLYGGWSLDKTNDLIATEGRWTVEDLADKAPRLLEDREGLASAATSIGDTMKGFGRAEPTV